MTQPWYTTFQVIKGPLGGGKRRNGGGGQGAHVFQEEQKGISRRRKDVGGGGGRPYQTDCKLTANKGESQEYYRAF